MPVEGSPDPIDATEENVDELSEENAEEVEVEVEVEGILYNYEIIYIDAETTNQTTKIVEATHIIADEDHLEMWWDNVMMFGIQKASLIQIRNVSLMDMPIP